MNEVGSAPVNRLNSSGVVPLNETLTKTLLNFATSLEKTSSNPRSMPLVSRMNIYLRSSSFNLSSCSRCVLERVGSPPVNLKYLYPFLEAMLVNFS